MHKAHKKLFFSSLVGTKGSSCLFYGSCIVGGLMTLSLRRRRKQWVKQRGNAANFESNQSVVIQTVCSSTVWNVKLIYFEFDNLES